MEACVPFEKGKPRAVDLARNAAPVLWPGTPQSWHLIIGLGGFMPQGQDLITRLFTADTTLFRGGRRVMCAHRYIGEMNVQLWKCVLL